MSKIRLEAIREQWLASKTPNMKGEYPIDFLLAEVDRLNAENDMMDQTIQGLMQAEHTQSLQLRAANEALKLAKEKMDNEQPSLSEAYVKIGKLSETLLHIANSGMQPGVSIKKFREMARKALGESK